MDEQEFVSGQLFRDTLIIQTSLTLQLTMIVESLVLVLKHRGLVAPELWERFFDEAANSAEAQKVRTTIERLRGHEPLQDILKDFSGLIQ